MRRSVAIAWRMFWENVKRPGTLIPWLLVPLVFTFIFGVVMLPSGVEGAGRHLAVAVVRQDDTLLASRFITELEASPVLETQVTTESVARARVRDSQVVAAVLIAPGFQSDLVAGRTPGLILVRQAETDIYVTAREEVRRALARLASAVVAADFAGAEPMSPGWVSSLDRTMAIWRGSPASLAAVEVSPRDGAPGLRQVDAKAIGFILMIILMSVMNSAGTILNERADGTWMRLLATPARKMEILSGYLLGYFLIGWLQFGLLILATRFLFGVDWGDPVLLAGVVSLYVFTATALGLLLAGSVKTFQQQSNVVAVAGTLTSLISGAFWPLEMSPPVIRALARATPQFWAGRCLTDTILRGRPDLQTIGPPLLVLAGMTLVLLGLAAGRVRFE